MIDQSWPAFILHNPQFPLGQIVVTANALSQLSPVDIHIALNRHSQKDWGALEPEDKSSNDYAFAHGGRILSVYWSGKRTKFYIITESDRSVTTILLPKDY